MGTGCAAGQRQASEATFLAELCSARPAPFLHRLLPPPRAEPLELQSLGHTESYGSARFKGGQAQCTPKSLCLLLVLHFLQL